MTKIVCILIQPNTEWTSIEVPAGSSLVWAEPGGIVVGGGTPSGIATFWRTEDYSFGAERCLIRNGPRTDPGSPGEEQPDFPYVEGGLQGAVPFINGDYLLWWKKSAYDAYPPNSASGE
ncbi:hypothetical protein ACFYT3_07850 [Nocardia amikacinitolerans]|uniref:Uncharacterized protein n=1 Tax=Nocardia amikacinitolerans TaxID=756689 RepID=A0A285LT43_9NOCA|nr:hypothetical protein [Nocardia amikacinitolerans]MCP2276433.1 hypothetical protein [Nocardia amikacinitolerans]MCP2291723.1 hypothetical protein [Nocardia amikacinitolerans]MCP2295186.1 hypothetical protein [Nocardia amikacinitolerans]SNY87613.1 hypothetical protein SAMN04244553_4561 [Nocardia amikacinitolerans]